MFSDLIWTKAVWISARISQKLLTKYSSVKQEKWTHFARLDLFRNASRLIKIYHSIGRYAAFMGAVSAIAALKRVPAIMVPLSYGGWRAESSPRAILDRTIVLCRPFNERAHERGRTYVNVHATLIAKPSRACVRDSPFLHANDPHAETENSRFRWSCKIGVFFFWKNIGPVIPTATETVFIYPSFCVALSASERGRARAHRQRQAFFLYHSLRYNIQAWILKRRLPASQPARPDICKREYPWCKTSAFKYHGMHAAAAIVAENSVCLHVYAWEATSGARISEFS